MVTYNMYTMQQHTSLLSSKHLDIIGGSLSGLCAIHCAFLPLFMALLPALGLGILKNEALEKSILVLSVILAFWSLRQGIKTHQKSSLMSLWGLSALCIGTQLFIHHEALAIIGALGLVACHFLNYRFSHQRGTQKSCAPQEN